MAEDVTPKQENNVDLHCPQHPDRKAIGIEQRRLPQDTNQICILPFDVTLPFKCQSTKGTQLGTPWVHPVSALEAVGSL